MLNRAYNSLKSQKSHVILHDITILYKNGKTTKMATDMIVGNKLGHKYIYPKTSTPSLDDYKQAFDKIKEKIKQNEEEDKNGVQRTGVLE